MTLVILISDKLKQGQIRGLYTSLSKCESNIVEMNNCLQNKKSRLMKKQVDLISAFCIHLYMDICLIFSKAFIVFFRTDAFHFFKQCAEVGIIAVAYLFRHFVNLYARCG